jgi:phage/conjugal plasmid C-4 type zinc finger TraR family protein
MIADDFVYNNEEESELGQLHAIHIHLNAIADVQRQLAAQARRPSSTYCLECGDDIPLARRELIPGVTLCIHCKQHNELDLTRF